ncbi:60S ribosomal protein l38 [Phtheirospermum japonicum]|uniref:60S ribosomal protein l38 n=1 Tax=Phtheirospermum japonicum TaxID=374723 RepID=A0A830CBF2_9LAMI|nr:60S ribosomal protein l38 [Phtheirospermum japonicum]
MPKKTHEIKNFLLSSRRKDAQYVKIKKRKDVVNFKVRFSDYTRSMSLTLVRPTN